MGTSGKCAKGDKKLVVTKLVVSWLILQDAGKISVQDKFARELQDLTIKALTSRILQDLTG